jgi:hypothetical protein
LNSQLPSAVEALLTDKPDPMIGYSKLGVWFGGVVGSCGEWKDETLEGCEPELEACERKDQVEEVTEDRHWS